MRAARVTETGGPDILELVDLDRPEPDDDEVLIRVEAASLNHMDVGIRSGEVGLLSAFALPIVPCFECAGVVEVCGRSVTAFEPGDRVAAMLGHGGGGAAEFAVAPQSQTVRLPADLDFARAAALPIAGLTALQGLFEYAHLRERPDARVLVNGASGGVGHFAVQLAARLDGTHVTGVCRGAKAAFVDELGADATIDFTERDFAESARTWDVIYDAAGLRELSEVEDVLADEGVLVTTRPSPRNIASQAASAVTPGPTRVRGVMADERPADIALLAELVVRGELAAHVDETFSLEAIAEAHRHLEGDELCGKVVVCPSEA
jgi:NADPH:quinone reductase-like Zn-dependent oxidoreductase